MHRRRLGLCFLMAALIISGCDAIAGIAPAPQGTAVPTESEILATGTAQPTLGEPEYIEAVYCWESHIDEGEYNLISFFASGNLIDVFVQPYTSCAEAWQGTKEYLGEEKLLWYSHGTYHLSGGFIRFSLSPAQSDKVVGEVTGTYSPEKMMLVRQGSEEREYIAVGIGD